MSIKNSTKLIVLSIVLAAVTGAGLVFCVAVLPVVLQARREAARREQCSENLRKIGAALRQYRTATVPPPPAIRVPNDAELARANKEARSEELLSKDTIIPKGVVYKKAGADVNRRGLAKLSQAFLTADHKDDEVFASTLICGPGLWRNIKDDAEMKKITTGVTTMEVPTNNGTQKFDGKLFQGKEEVAAFWKVFLRKYEFGAKAVIRRPTASELNLYWAMIPYDITEPIFVIEGKDATILTQFAGDDVKIGWIDDYKNMHVGEEPK